MFSRRWFLQILGATTGTALVVQTTMHAPTAAARIEAETIDAEIVDDHAPVRLRGRSRITPLETFLRARGIRPAMLARESGYSRAHLLRLRLGQVIPSFRCKIAIVASLRRLSRERVQVRDVFPGALLVLAPRRSGLPVATRRAVARDALLRFGARWA
jgi:hypothetical protein